MREARARLAALDALPARDHPAARVSLAYYAMLNAGRAALSERDRYARTHRGTWQLVRELLVASGKLDAALVRAAQDAQDLREGGDYRAIEIEPDEAERVVENARRLVAEIDHLIGE